MVCDCRHVRRSGARRVGCWGAGDAARSAAVLHRILEARWPVRRLGGGLPAVVHQSECAAQARRARHAAAVLAGHQRYAHITALRCDPVNPPLLGMRKVVSEDAVRRGLAKIDETAGLDWLQAHLDYCVSPLLQEPWVLDVDTTIKPLYGTQEGAVVGYNPRKPGRPSHCYHTYMMSTLRLVLSV